MILNSAQDPFEFDADPDPGSALEKMDPDPGHKHFFKICQSFQEAKQYFRGIIDTYRLVYSSSNKYQELTKLGQK